MCCTFLSAVHNWGGVGIQDHLFWLFQAGLGSRVKETIICTSLSNSAGKGYLVPEECILEFPEEPTLSFPASHYQYYVYPTMWYLSLPVMLNLPLSGIVHTGIQESRSLSCQDHLRILIRRKIKHNLSFWKYSASIWKAPLSSREEIFKKWNKRTSERGRHRHTYMLCAPSPYFLDFYPLNFPLFSPLSL